MKVFLKWLYSAVIACIGVTALWVDVLWLRILATVLIGVSFGASIFIQVLADKMMKDASKMMEDLREL